MAKKLNIKELKSAAEELNEVLELDEASSIDMKLKEKKLKEEIVDVAKLLEPEDVLSEDTANVLEALGVSLPEEGDSGDKDEDDEDDDDGVEEESASDDVDDDDEDNEGDDEEDEEDEEDEDKSLPADDELPNDVDVKLLRQTVKEINEKLGTKLRAVGVKKETILTSIHETIKNPENMKKLKKVSKEVKAFLKTFTIVANTPPKNKEEKASKKEKKEKKEKKVAKKEEKKEKKEKKVAKKEEKEEKKEKLKRTKSPSRKERNAYIKSLIKKGEYTPSQIQEMTLKKFPDNTPAAVRTVLVDCKNPKYNSFKDEGIGFINKKGNLTFKK